MEKLEYYGIEGNTYDLIKSYLSARQQQVSINEAISEPREVTYGVPQGTVLGPLLCTLYINSLLSMETKGSTINFADDTPIFIKQTRGLR